MSLNIALEVATNKLMDDRETILADVFEIFSKYSGLSERPSLDDTIEAAFLSAFDSQAWFVPIRARARRSKWMDELQLQFGIYFSLEELASPISFGDLIAVIQGKLEKNKSGALRSLKDHAGGGEGMNQLIFLNVVLALPLVSLARGSTTQAFVAAGIALVLNGWLASVHIRGHLYNKKLISRIQQRP